MRALANIFPSLQFNHFETMRNAGSAKHTAGVFARLKECVWKRWTQLKRWNRLPRFGLPKRLYRQKAQIVGARKTRSLST